MQIQWRESQNSGSCSQKTLSIFSIPRTDLVALDRSLPIYHAVQWPKRHIENRKKIVASKYGACRVAGGKFEAALLRHARFKIRP